MIINHLNLIIIVDFSFTLSGPGTSTKQLSSIFDHCFGLTT